MHPHDSSLYSAESSSLLPAPLKMADVAEVTALCSSRALCSVNSLIFKCNYLSDVQVNALPVLLTVNSPCFLKKGILI